MMLANKTILLVLSLAVSMAVVGAGVYYGTDAFEREVRIVAEEAPSEIARADTKGHAAEELPAEAAEEETLPVPPTFDIVRVEPSGEIVTAGRAAPGAKVEMLLDEKAIASDTANNDGEWSMVPREPLAVGSHDLVLRATGADGEGGPVEGERVVVVIEGEDRTPLVALSRPGTPSQVVQRPEESVAQLEPAAEEAAEPKVAEAEPAAEEGAEPQVAEAEPAAEEAAEPKVAEATPPDDGQVQEQTVAALGVAVAEPEAESLAGGDEPAQAEVEAEEEVPGLTIAALPPKPAPEPAAMAATENPVVAADAPVAEEAADVGEAADVAIEMVEVEEPDNIHVTGRAGPGSSVRLYVNNRHLDDVRAGEDGRWAATVRQSVPPGRYAVRADALDGDGQVGGRSEVRFDRVQLALADERSRTDAREAEPKQQVAATMPDVPVVADAAAEPAKVQEERVAAVAAGPVTADTMTGDQPDEMGSAEGFSAPNAVFIERGDNLWRISRMLYGRGSRYSVLYEANRAQIRDPDLIYPGQIFTVPVLDDAAE